MTVRKFINNYSSTLAESISNSDTSFDLTDASAVGSALTGNDYVALTIQSGTDVEIIHVTSVASNTITCVRGQQGTSGTAFSSGASIECRVTAAALKIPGHELVAMVDLGSGVSSQSLPISAGSYKILGENITFSSSGASFNIQVGTSGGTQTSSYYQSGTILDYSGDSSNRVNNGSAGVLAPSVNNQSSNPGSLEIDVGANVEDTGTKKTIGFKFRQQAKLHIGSIVWDSSAAAYTAIVLSMSSGDINSGSKFLVYKSVYQ